MVEGAYSLATGAAAEPVLRVASTAGHGRGSSGFSSVIDTDSRLGPPCSSSSRGGACAAPPPPSASSSTLPFNGEGVRDEPPDDNESRGEGVRGEGSRSDSGSSAVSSSSDTSASPPAGSGSGSAVTTCGRHATTAELLQSGQVSCPANHRSMHCEWKKCEHFSCRSSSPSSKSSWQTEQC